jgi:hypothetical protein
LACWDQQLAPLLLPIGSTRIALHAPDLLLQWACFTQCDAGLASSPASSIAQDADHAVEHADSVAELAESAVEHAE